MTLGPILGDERCPHPQGKLTYYHSGYSGNYAVCGLCGGHLWGSSEEGIEIPDGLKAVDLDEWDDDPDATYSHEHEQDKYVAPWPMPNQRREA